MDSRYGQDDSKYNQKYGFRSAPPNNKRGKYYGNTPPKKARESKCCGCSMAMVCCVVTMVLFALILSVGVFLAIYYRGVPEVMLRSFSPDCGNYNECLQKKTVNFKSEWEIENPNNMPVRVNTTMDLFTTDWVYLGTGVMRNRTGNFAPSSSSMRVTAAFALHSSKQTKELLDYFTNVPNRHLTRYVLTCRTDMLNYWFVPTKYLNRYVSFTAPDHTVQVIPLPENSMDQAVHHLGAIGKEMKRGEENAEPVTQQQDQQPKNGQQNLKEQTAITVSHTLSNEHTSDRLIKETKNQQKSNQKKQKKKQKKAKTKQKQETREET